MLQISCIRVLLRVSALLTLGVSCAICVFIGRNFKLASFSFIISGAGALLFAGRDCGTPFWLSVFVALWGMLLVPLICLIDSVSGLGPPACDLLMTSVIAVPPSVLMVRHLACMLSDESRSFAMKTHREVAENHLYFMSLAAWLSLSVIAYVFIHDLEAYGRWGTLFLSVQGGAFVMLYLRSAAGGRCRCADDIEMERSRFEGAEPTSRPADRSAGAGSMGLYDRIVLHMEDRKPFLSSAFSLDEMARSLGTNTGYVSRAINNGSGVNFSQFVNRYRVYYAMDCFRKDPGLKVIELGQISGFNSKVTFNMAFKLVMGVTPGEWCRTYLERQQRHGLPSMKKERRRPLRLRFFLRDAQS